MVRVAYIRLDVVDCTADPHVVNYADVKKMLEDVVRVCESDLVQAIPVVRLYVGREIETADGMVRCEEEYESDDYTDSPLVARKKEPASGPYAEKHKVAGLYFYSDSPYEGKTEEVVELPDGRTMTIKVGKLPPGLTGVKEAVKIILGKLEENPNFRDFELRIGVVWRAFGAHNCSDYITANGRDMTVDYSNQDWYPESNPKAYARHLKKLGELLGVDFTEDIWRALGVREVEA
ncbi:MAG: hypothetical protein DRN06_08960 [Thermoprotei archaeon]|nr:MAG: hypothetical protein DRN06_08960 [Thermoprotei archaeon]